MDIICHLGLQRQEGFQTQRSEEVCWAENDSHLGNNTLDPYMQTQNLEWQFNRFNRFNSAVLLRIFQRIFCKAV